MRLSGILADYGEGATDLERDLEATQSRHQQMLIEKVLQTSSLTVEACESASQHMTAAVVKMMVALVTPVSLWYAERVSHPLHFKQVADFLRMRSHEHAKSTLAQLLDQRERTESIEVELAQALDAALLPIFSEAHLRSWRLHQRRVTERHSGEVHPEERAEVTCATDPVDSDPTLLALISERKELLTEFRNRYPECRLTWVDYSAKVHKRDRERWRKGQLPDRSSISNRIRRVLEGTLSLRKPHKNNSAE